MSLQWSAKSVITDPGNVCHQEPIITITSQPPHPASPHQTQLRLLFLQYSQLSNMQFAIGREISSGVGDGLPPPLSTKGWLIITEVYISFPDIQNEIMKYARRTVRRDKCVFSILILTLLHLTRAGWWTRGILIPVNTSRADRVLLSYLFYLLLTKWRLPCFCLALQ